MNQFDRNRNQSKQVIRRAHDDAVRLATTPGLAALGVAGNRVSTLTTITESETTADVDGNTIEGQGLWNVDSWNRMKWS